MNTPRTIAAVGALASLSLLVGACSSSHRPSSTVFGGSTTTTVAATTTTVAATTTLAPATTLAPIPTTSPPTTAPLPTTTVAPTTTTTTLPPGASLPLRFDGIGDVRFGTEPDDVIKYVSDIIGGPTADSGWNSADQLSCPGTEARTVFWDDLKLTFGDESTVSSGRRHFFAWSYGPPAGSAPAPAGMATMLGVTIGTSVAAIQKAYPGVQLFAGDETVTASAQLSEGLFVFFTDITLTGVVTQILGGTGCGE